MTDKERAIFGTDGLSTQPGWATVFNFDKETGEYLGAIEEYFTMSISLPASSCLNAPPSAISGWVFCRNKENTEWLKVKDNRGKTVFEFSNGSPVVISTLGPIPEGFTTNPPQTPYDVWDGVSWVTDKAKQNKADVTAANLKKEELLQEVNAATQLLQTQLTLGLITDADKTILIEWMKYAQALQEVDTSTAPNVQWPPKPIN